MYVKKCLEILKAYDEKSKRYSQYTGREKYLKLLGVEKLGLFGSAARGEWSQRSDLDFIIVLERETFDAYMDIKFFLEDLFGCSVDLVIEENIKPELRAQILSEAIYAPGI